MTKNKLVNFIFPLAFFAICLFFVTGVAKAAIIEPGFQVENVAGGFTLPTAIAFAGDGRIFVAEKGGDVRLVKNGVLVQVPVISLTDVNTFGDRGLIGMALDPDFVNNGYMYLSYTYENTPGLNFGGPKTARIVRVKLVGDVADESSKLVLVGSIGGNQANPSCENFAVTEDCIASDSSSHSAGGLKFGPDGFLYASTGDGADFSNVDPRALRAQNLDSLSGKILRIYPNGSAPTSNPFYDGNPNSNRSKIFAYGLRNMYRFSFHPVTGKLFGGDVGWSTWEEINRILPGANFGWPCWEGNSPTTYNCTASGVTLPTYTYAHNASGAGSVSAGAFPSGGAYPNQYANSFFIGDYAQNWIKYVTLDSSNNVSAVNTVIDSGVWPVDLVSGLDGNVYYLDIAMGSLNRLTHTFGNRTPVPQVSANPTSGLAPLNVNFSSAGSIDPDADAFSYSWSFGDGTNSTLPNPTHVYSANGTYTATLTLTDVHGASATKSISVTVGNQAPTANIVSPASGSLYAANQIVNLVGSGSDPEDGVLPQSAFNWQVILHHNTHIHYSQTFSGTSTPSFLADDHSATDVYMEVILTVTDSAGLTSSRSINMYLNNGSGSGNLISNPSVEIPETTPGSPVSWHQGWYGQMDAVFTYPVTGFDGASAVKVDVGNYTSGSAKWYFDPVFVTPGQTYDFYDYYTSNVSSEQVAQLGYSDGTYAYQVLGTLPPTATPTKATGSIAVPTGVQTLTVFHQLSSNGTLTTDNFSLTLANSKPKNLIINGDFEAVSGTNPTAWTPVSWGNHVTNFTYPVLGNNGGAAAKLEITSYPFVGGDGDSRWQFDDVVVTPGTEYTFSDDYVSSTISDIIGRYTMSDGSYHYFGLVKELQPTTVWATATKAFVPPVGAVSVTFIHLISSVGSLTIDNANLHVSGTGTPAETVPPVVQFTNPVEGMTVSGNVNITTTATDNVGVAGVYFAVDGVVFGSEVTTAPYNISWNSTSVPDGPHLLKATVHDAAGNNSTHTINILVNNSTTPPPPTDNSIQNPSLETAGTGGDPAFWSRGGWGTNNRTYIYPVAGSNGVSAARVETNGYVDGDAKWYFADVSVTPGTLYTFSHFYRSNVNTVITVRYALSNNTFQYVDLANVVPSDVWASSMVTLTPPANTISLSVFHSLISNGWLEVDDYSLTAGSGDVFTKGMVSFTFDDGWISHYTDAMPILNAANIKGSFFIISDQTANATPAELAQNSDLETAGAGSDPAFWSRGGWGTNNRTYTYPVAGPSSSNAVQVSITSYTDGDAKWYASDVPLIANTEYAIADNYKSNTQTEALVRYTMSDGSFQYVFLSSLPATGGSWQHFSSVVTAPVGAVSATLFHVLAQVGELNIDDYSFKKVQITIDQNQMLALQSAGHEVGSHTKTHPYLTTLSAAQQQDEIFNSKINIANMGIVNVDNFVYPYGDYDANVKTMVQTAGYTGARGISRGYNLKTSDKYALKIQQIDRTVTLAQVQAWIAAAAANKTWLIFMFHQINSDPAADLGATPAFLQQIVNESKAANVDIVTMRQGLAQMN